jgi:hypothetical protein
VSAVACTFLSTGLNAEIATSNIAAAIIAAARDLADTRA